MTIKLITGIQFRRTDKISINNFKRSKQLRATIIKAQILKA